MDIEIKVPPLGESIAEATVSRLIKANGSFVRGDEEILELETDKVNQVLYAPKSGKITFSVEVGDSVKMGQVVGVIDTAVQEEKTKTPVEKSQTPPVPTPSTAVLAKEEKAARLLPDNFLTTLSTPAPVEKKIEEKTTSSRRKMSALRKSIAKRLVEVKNETAMLTTFNEIDLSKVMQIRSQEKENFAKKHGVKLGFMSFFVTATVAALKAVPAVNAMIDKEEIVTFSNYDIGVAVSTEKGLMVPVIRDCDRLTFSQIEKSLEEYAKKAREGSLSLNDLKGGSFTITNGGTFGSLLSTPILNPPQSAILGMHAIVKRPVVVEDQIVIRPMMYVALSYDHRIIDGKEAVLFLVHIKQSLEDPSRLLLDL